MDLKRIIGSVILLAVIIAAFETDNGLLGILGIIVFFLILAIIKMFMNFDQYKLVHEHIESTLFGKPLSRKFWKKGEINDIKFKINWRDKCVERRKIRKNK